MWRALTTRLKQRRQFSLFELMVVVTATAIVVGAWAQYGFSVLLGSILGLALALGIGQLVSHITRPRRTPLLGALVGPFVAHLSVMYVYYYMYQTDIRNWSLFEYLVHALVASVAGACAMLPRSNNPLLSAGVGTLAGGCTGLLTAAAMLFGSRTSELLADPGRVFSAATVFLQLFAGLGLVLGGATGIVAGLIRLWWSCRYNAERHPKIATTSELILQAGPDERST